MRVTLIAAVARNRVIGRDGDIPWHLPADLARFKRRTLGHPLVMGRKTYRAIGRPLPGRTTVVVTRDPASVGNPAEPGDGAGGELRVAGSPEEALELARQVAEEAGVDEIFVAGGGEIYRRLLPHAHRLDLTEVELEPEGDATFPAIDPGRWREVEREEHAPDERNPHPYRFRLLERRGAPPRSPAGDGSPSEKPPPGSGG